MIAYEDARKEMQAKAREAWFAAYTAVLQGSAAPNTFLYHGLEVNPLPAGFYARVTIQPVIQEKGNLGPNRYVSKGWIAIQIFGPKSDSSPHERAVLIAAQIRKRFVGSKTAGGVWFKRETVDENMPTEKDRIQVQMKAEWQSEEILEIVS